MHCSRKWIYKSSIIKYCSRNIRDVQVRQWYQHPYQSLAHVWCAVSVCRNSRLWHHKLPWGTRMTMYTCSYRHFLTAAWKPKASATYPPGKMRTLCTARTPRAEQQSTWLLWDLARHSLLRFQGQRTHIPAHTFPWLKPGFFEAQTGVSTSQPLQPVLLLHDLGMTKNRASVVAANSTGIQRCWHRSPRGWESPVAAGSAVVFKDA